MGAEGRGDGWGTRRAEQGAEGWAEPGADSQANPGTSSFPVRDCFGFLPRVLWAPMF